MNASPSRLRQYQDSMANLKWRIQLIPFDDPSKPMKIKTNRLALVGAVIFLGGIALHFVRRDIRFIWVAVSGVVVMFVGGLLAARERRSGWIMLNAVCVDREIRPALMRYGKGITWPFRTLCRFKYAGNDYTVTPMFGTSFASEEATANFLNRTIGPDGTCRLRVNPRNPLETELVGGKVTDTILY